MLSRIEISRQLIPAADGGTGPWAPSVPLHDLADAPPAADQDFSLFNGGYVFSNDISARSYEAALNRVCTAEFQQATNRVAVVVGEAALMAALPLIPEDTIIMLDREPQMCGYLQCYVRALREESDILSWASRILREDLSGRAEEFGTALSSQVEKWGDARAPHPSRNYTGYRLSHERAQQKAIIPWNVDVQDAEGIQELGDAIRERNGTVTFMNLTNVMPFAKTPRFATAADYASVLQALPTTLHAPILTSSIRGESRARKPRSFPGTCFSTGPFFGLENLAKFGGHVRGQDRGPVDIREYAESTLFDDDDEDIDNSFDDDIGTLLSDLLGGEVIVVSMHGDTPPKL